MPLNAVGWTNEEDEKLAELVQPNTFLYNVSDPSRKNILARQNTWQSIACTLFKPVEECKKRWRGLRDGYMRNKRMGSVHKSKQGIFEKLQFLDGTTDMTDGTIDVVEEIEQSQDSQDIAEQQVITDNQEYYEITLLTSQGQEPVKMIPKREHTEEPPAKILKGKPGRKKSMPIPRNIAPVKILPKPVIMNRPKIVRYIENPKVPEPTAEPKSQVIDNLIEKILRENTNEIDVFFRSMAASVKKLQPNLIPKVKMEVCNVIAKYEMQSIEKNSNNF